MESPARASESLSEPFITRRRTYVSDTSDVSEQASEPSFDNEHECQVEKEKPRIISAWGIGWKTPLLMGGSFLSHRPHSFDSL